MKGKFMSQLVYSESTKLETAVQDAFVLWSKGFPDKTAEVRWPPTAECVQALKLEDVTPSELNEFLQTILDGKLSNTASTKDGQAC